MKIKEAFGKTLNVYRVKHRISQEDLGNETELSRTYISELERGKKEPSISTLFRICKILDVKPSEFIHKLETRLK